MPPLYKRYIPPKPSQPLETNTVAPVVPATLNGDATEKKRKRERTEEEVAQRKAKKLDRKTNHSQTTQPDESSEAVSKQQSSQKTAQFTPLSTTTDQPAKPPQSNGDFSHIKNVKKRHKLEKEARKARKAAEKSGNHNDTEQIEDVEGLEPDEAGAGRTEVAKETTSTQIAGLAAVNPNDGSHAESEPEEAKSTIPAPKKRRHKLEAVLNGADERSTPAAEDDEKHLKKHAGVLGKFQKATKAREDPDEVPPTEVAEAEAVVMRDLAPLPQPAPRTSPAALPSYSALPKWLENPILISPQSTASFSDLRLNPGIVDHLSKLQFREALPVQQATIPLLLDPGSAGAKYTLGTENVVPDLAISAPTGSGKTLAYLLPIVESLKSASDSGKLRTLVVVPTRELVSQVSAIATSLAKGSKVSVGMASGSTKLSQEQDRLVKHAYIYDPVGYEQSIARVQRSLNPSEDSDEDSEYEFDVTNLDGAKANKSSDLAVKAPANHVSHSHSAVDLLVCTPGRLREHLKSTVGFSIAHLQWLVLDEADKLLDEQYDGFIELLQSHLTRPRSGIERDARESYLRQSAQWDENSERRVRKVLLSATMTQDISKLLDLQLRRPKLLVVQDNSAQANTVGGAEQSGNGKQLLELPPTLTECCIPVGDGAEKPLHLVKVLESKIIPENFLPLLNGGDRNRVNDVGHKDEGSEDTDSDGDSESSSDASSTDLSSDSSSNSSSAADSSSDESDTPETNDIHPSRQALLAASSKPKSTSPPTVLIFASSNEAAMRLSRLLKLLRPTWAPWITTLAKSKQKMPPLKKDQPSLTICTDRASRGLDMISNRQITHVLQYDVPRSVESYVHRVGRTARAGRAGEAFTLYTHSEARWFLYQVARTADVRRSRTVEKVDITPVDDSLRKKFERALDHMRGEAFG